MDIIKFFKREIEKLNPSYTTKKKVKIRTKEKCPKCGKSFQELPGIALFCPKCKTTPRRFYIDLTWQGKRIRVYSDKQGNPLSSYEQAKRLASVIELEIQNKTFDPSKYVKKDFKNFLFENYIQKWIDFSQDRLKPSSFKTRKVIASKYLIPYFKSKDIREIRTSDIQDFYSALKKKKLSSKTIYNIFAELKALLNFAKKREDIEKVPIFPNVKIEEKPIYWLTQEQQKQILEALPEKHRPIFRFMFTYGTRPGEARALTWDCVDFTNKIIYIKRTFSHRRLVETTKEGRWKVLPLLPEIEQMLKSLYANRKKNTKFVFSPGSGAEHYGEKILPKLWKQACSRVGIKGITLYEGVRHSFVMQRLTAGFSYEEVGPCVGHSTPQTTRKYGRLMAQNLIKVFKNQPGKIIPFSKNRIKSKVENQ